MQQIQHFVTERDIKVAPSVRHRVANRELQRSFAREAARVADRRRGRVESEAGTDPAAIDQETEKAATVAAHVEDTRAMEVDVDGIEHGVPDEAVLVLHRLVFGGALPVTLGHRSTLTRDELDRPQARLDGGRGMHDHQLVGVGFLGEAIEILADRGRRADRGVAHHLDHVLTLRRLQHRVELLVGQLSTGCEEPLHPRPHHRVQHRCPPRSSVSATTTLAPAITYGASSCFDG